MLGSGPARAALQYDPAVDWRTLETPHFQVHYPVELEAIARKAARFAEDAHAKLSPYLKSTPQYPTQLVLTDFDDLGLAASVPYPNNAIALNLTQPAESNRWGRYDSYLKLAITHEYTHILNLEKYDGVSWLSTRLFGRLFSPNYHQPIFMIEGLAIHTEGNQGPGGREQEGDFDMILRCAALEGSLSPLDRAGGYYPTDWPFERPYVYGSFFFRYLVDRFGEDAPERIARSYAANPFFGLNWAIRQVLPGQDARSIWNGMTAFLETRARRQLDEIKRLPIEEGTPVTRSGLVHRRPYWTPDGHLGFVSSDFQHPSRIVEVDPDGSHPRVVVDATPIGSNNLHKDDTFLDGCAVDPDGQAIYLSAPHEFDRYHVYQDLFRIDRRTGRVSALTHGARVRAPALSPDGSSFLAAVNSRGHHDLVLFDRQGHRLKTVVAFDDGTQVSDVAWSPDGREAVGSVWRRGSRDLYRIDPASGSIRPLWRDLANDISPSWTPDGRYLVYSSDRSGVFNLYSYRLSDGEVRRLTNVVGGAIEPAVSPDGKAIAFINYSARGYDVHVMPFRPEAGLPVWGPPQAFALDGHLVPLGPPPETEAIPLSTASFPSQRYNPLPSLAPKVWNPTGSYNDQGIRVGATTHGVDALSLHQFMATAGWGITVPRPYYHLTYQNDQWAPTLLAAVDGETVRSNGTVPRLGTIQPWQDVSRQSLSATIPFLSSLGISGMGTSLTGGLRNQIVSTLGYVDATAGSTNQGQFISRDALAGLSKNLLTRLPGLPADGPTQSLYLTLRHADHYRSTFGTTLEEGNLAEISYEHAVPWFGGPSFDRVDGELRLFRTLPFAHQVIGWRLAGGLNLGRSDGDFYLGGTTAGLQTLAGGLGTVGDFATYPLRGYGAATLSGSRMVATSLEYRFPLFEVQRGLDILPIYLSQVHGTVFYDVGTAGSDKTFATNGLRHGIGFELLGQVSVATPLSDLRAGLAYGLSPGGSLQPYVGIGGSF
jgi:hypothetical protein